MIRAATHADLPQLIELGALMHAESRYRVLSFNADKLRITLDNLLTSPMGYLWVAEEDWKLVGGLAAICGQHWASDDMVSSDLALFVAPTHRGSLSVLRLVNGYRQWARGQGAKLVDLGVSTGIGADRTADLFDRMGFPRCGTIHSAE